MHFRDVSDHTLLQQFYVAAVPAAGRTLVTHLSDHAVFARDLPEHPRLPQRPHKRLLHVAVETETHGGHGDGRMHVVRR